MREHWNDVPGDIAGEDAENLPGGFGTEYNPDNDPDAMYDSLESDLEGGALGRGFTELDVRGGDTPNTGFAHGINDDATVDPADLLPNEHERNEEMIEGGAPLNETETHQQAENRSVETEG